MSKSQVIDKIIKIIFKIMADDSEYWTVNSHGPNIDWEKVKEEIKQLLDNML